MQRCLRQVPGPWEHPGLAGEEDVQTNDHNPRRQVLDWQDSPGLGACMGTEETTNYFASRGGGIEQTFQGEVNEKSI